MSAVLAANDSDDLQDLFDSIVAANATGAGPAATAAKPQPEHPAAAGQGDLITRIGQMTRSLHENLRELGFDKLLEDTASEIPEARDRLAYVATLTERAAQRVLTATELAMPLQQKLEKDASDLSARWQKVFSAQVGAEDFKTLAQSTVSFLNEVPTHTKATNGHLHEIMMAQDFQDLTGQVVKKINELVHRFEHEMLRLLVENAPTERRPVAADSLLNGPVISAEGRGDVVTTQGQVDELLESLGF
jgi:chemotaxis protein CheZ